MDRGGAAMSDINFDMSDLTGNVNAEIAAIEAQVAAEVKADAETINESCKEDTPVVTGTALAGWEVVKESDTVTVVQNLVPYSGWLNDGTTHFAGIHMVEKAIQKLGDE